MVKLLLTGLLAASLTSLHAAALPEGHEPDEIEVKRSKKGQASFWFGILAICR
jgi:hypothetical protein